MPKRKHENMNDIYVPTIRNEDIEGKKINKIEQRNRNKRIKEKKARQIELDKIDNDMETVINMTNKNANKNRQQQRTKITKEQRNQIKKKKRRKIIIRVIILIMFIIGGIIFALVSPIFNISKINVVNNNYVSSDTIISLSEIKINQNLFKYNTKKTEGKIKDNAYIEDVKIRRKILNEVEIDVKERERSFNVEFLNGYAIINNQGYILEISEVKDEGLPVIKGISTNENEIQPKNRLNTEDLKKLEVVLQIINVSRNYELQDKISGFDITNSNDYIMYMETEKKTVYFGDEMNLNTKILWIPAVLEDNAGVEGNIYLNGTKVRFEVEVKS